MSREVVVPFCVADDEHNEKFQNHFATPECSFETTDMADFLQFTENFRETEVVFDLFIVHRGVVCVSHAG